MDASAVAYKLILQIAVGVLVGALLMWRSGAPGAGQIVLFGIGFVLSSTASLVDGRLKLGLLALAVAVFASLRRWTARLGESFVRPLAPRSALCHGSGIDVS
jgi:hypothetical protein